MNICFKQGIKTSKRQRLAALFFSLIAALLLTTPAARAGEQLQDHDSIYQAVSKFIKQSTGKTGLIKPINANQRVIKCQQDLQVDFPFNNQKTIRVVCEKTTSKRKPSWKLHLQVDVSQSLQVWRTNKALKNGQLIQTSDVSLELYQGHDLGQLLSKDLSPVGRYTKHPLQKSQWLKKSDLSTNIQVWQSKQLIKAGTVINKSLLQPVTVNKRQTSANAVTDLQDIIGKVSRYNLAADRAITHQDVVGRQKIWVAMHNLPTNRAIVADDLNLEWRLDHQLRQPGFSDINKILGKVPKSYISKGRVITANLLRIPYLVTEGAVVRLTITTSSLSISSDAKALGNGNKGDRVQVEVLGSGKLREGIVIAKGVLELVE